MSIYLSDEDIRSFLEILFVEESKNYTLNAELRRLKNGIR